MSKFYSVFIVFGLFALYVNGQKLPFQGKLLENGQPANGEKTVVFALVGDVWTESHTLTVVDGLYSVVLGSTTPLPLDIFDDAPERQLSIRVEGELLPYIKSCQHGSLGAGTANWAHVCTGYNDFT